MSFHARKGGKCLLCTFRISEWLALSVEPATGARSFSEAVRKVGSGAKKPLIRYSGPRSSKAPDRFGSHPIPSSSRRRPGQQNAFTVSPSDRKIGSKQLFSRGETTYGVFGRLMLEELQRLERNLVRGEKSEYEAWGIFSVEALKKRLADFEMQIRSCVQMAEDGKISKEVNPLFSRFRRAFVAGGIKSLYSEVKFAFITSAVEAKFSSQDKTNQDKLADIRYPFDWFPATRALHRTIHLHVGPTNSGKTYQALKRLEAAETGIYAGPLRLLAHEVYSRFNAKGKSCALVTGEERRVPEDGKMVMSSCTVEMMPLNKKVDIAVIDEIQMMADADRGWAWTQAFLGVQADEVHLCGELRTIELVSDLCAAMGDELVIHRYERLSPLATQNRSLEGDLTKLKKGDAVILFSRMAIHAMKGDIERITGKRCAVIYGSLPPETRAQQAELFNNPDNDYDFLVASDAVGMGLNLGIKRIIFESVSKHDGVSYRVVQPSEIKQIAGRAGRYKTAHQAVKEAPSGEAEGSYPPQLPLIQKRDSTNGLVTTLERFDLQVVQKAMSLEVEPLKTAGIAPPANVLYRFASYFPKGTAFSYVILRLYDICKLSELFHMCRIQEQTTIADLIEPYNLSTMDRITFIAAPVALRDFGFGSIVQEFAECVANQSGGELLDLKTLDLELLDMDKNDHPLGSKAYLRAAETLHKALTLYLWLSYRFAGVFRSQALAFHTKALVEEKIDECLAEVHFDEAQKKKLNFLRKKTLELDMAEQEVQRQAKEGLGFDEETAANEERAVDGSDERNALEDEFAEMEDNDELLDEEEQSPASEANVPIPPVEQKSEFVSV